MSRVLVVSKTRMHGDHVCVGGHDLDERMRSLRLLQPDGSNMPGDTRFEIGQVWELDYRTADVQPPHIEDVLVDLRGARHIDTVASLSAFIQAQLVPWVDLLFEGTLRRTSSGAGYVPIDGPFPLCSTGYWLPEQALDFDGDRRYVFSAEEGQRRIPYVGLTEPISRIPPRTLVRVSLARPWTPSSAPAGLYLQLSGWYEERSLD